MSDDAPTVTEADIKIKPEDLPSATLPDVFAADEVVYDSKKGITKFDGTIYHVSGKVADTLSDD